MFRLSRKGEYALRTMFHLSVVDKICTTDEIAKEQDIPKPFLKKIIQSLRVAGFIKSAKGQKGGISLNVKKEDLTVREVIEKIEGPLFLNECLICQGTCPRDEVCPLHEMWQKGQKAVLEVLDSYRFDILVQRHKELAAIKEAGGGASAPSP
jgi:Rrf2 family protein